MSAVIQEHLTQMNDVELEEMVRGEYLRRLVRYKKIDEIYRKKYNMTFEEFETRNIVAERGYSWEVESDAQEWKAALDGIETILFRLKEINVEAL